MNTQGPTLFKPSFPRRKLSVDARSQEQDLDCESVDVLKRRQRSAKADAFRELETYSMMAATPLSRLVMTRLPQELQDMVISQLIPRGNLQMAFKPEEGYRFFINRKKVEVPTYMGKQLSVAFFKYLYTTCEFGFGGGEDCLMNGKMVYEPNHQGYNSVDAFVPHIRDIRKFKSSNDYGTLPDTPIHEVQELIRKDHYKLGLHPQELISKIKFVISYKYFQDAQCWAGYGDDSWIPGQKEFRKRKQLTGALKSLLAVEREGRFLTVSLECEECATDHPGSQYRAKPQATPAMRLALATILPTLERLRLAGWNFRVVLKGFVSVRGNCATMTDSSGVSTIASWLKAVDDWFEVSDIPLFSSLITNRDRWRERSTTANAWSLRKPAPAVEAPPPNQTINAAGVLHTHAPALVSTQRIRSWHDLHFSITI